MRRTGALLALGVAATFLVLGGVVALFGDSDGAASPSPGSTSAIGSSGPTASPPVVPLTPAPGTAVLVGAGDIADCSLDGDEATARLLDGIEGTVFTAGDNAYENGSPDDFRDCYGPTWGRHLERTRPAAGNHDWRTRDAAGYLGYFGERANNADGDTWYSYDLGDWHVVVLDSDCEAVDGCGPGSAQGDWLAADVAASDARCTVAVWHHPRFSSGDHGNDASVDPFWRALHAAGAEIVVNGHDHDYERFAQQDPDGAADGGSGIREFVVGTGGAALRGFEAPFAQNSQVRASISHGVLMLTLRPGGYDWRFISVDGAFADQGAATCH